MVSRRIRRDAAYVATSLRDFLNGTGGPWDWDNFTSLSIPDPNLDRLRKLAGAVPLPLDADGRRTLEFIAEDVEQLALTPRHVS